MSNDHPAPGGQPGSLRRASRRRVSTSAVASASRACSNNALPFELVHAAMHTMLLSRGLDDLEIVLKRQNHIYFQISGAGHEATLIAAAHHLRPGYDWFFPYYRDRALCLGLGVTAEDLLLQAVGAARCPASGGRQMPSHWCDRQRHIVSEASTTGTQYLSAVGAAEAAIFAARRSHAPVDITFGQDEVVYCSSGEGATSQGVFFEALNTACMDRLPVLFHIEDNGYAISTPVREQTAGGSISELVATFPHLLRIAFDGCSLADSLAAWEKGVKYARERRGPVLLHASVVRPYSHSLSDDEKLYRSQSEIAEQAARDPLSALRATYLCFGDDAASKLQALELEVDAELERARERSLAAPAPRGDSAERFVYSPRVDPCVAPFGEQQARSDGNDLTLLDAVNAAMHDEMAGNPRIVVFGQDVADLPRDYVGEALRGKGGVFKATHGLQTRFGPERVFNAPLAEANIVGRAFGMAVRGLKPAIEIQFFDYIWPAMMHLRSEVALLRWRSNNAWQCPFVIRAAYGGYLKGGSVYHSQTGESIFTHIPGLRVVLPSNARDAYGLLVTALRCEDPVLFLEHKHLYRQTYNRAPHPGAGYTVAFGKAAIVRTGADVTIVTYGALVKRSLDAANQLAADGIEAEVLDLRTLSPYDWEAISASVRKTNHVVIAHEESRSWGFGAEIAARIGEELFYHLDAPPARVAAGDTFVGYHPNLEDHTLPQTADLVAAARNVLR